MSDQIGEDAPAIRLCHLFKWGDFDGYGFNLHGEKSKPGQYIGKVDQDSPAEHAGLKANDRIIEVNGTNISNENHKQVVQRIKQLANETKLLVVDEAADKYYKSRNIIVKGTMPNVTYLKTPVPRPSNKTTVVLTSVNNETVNGNGSVHSEEDRNTHVSDSGSGSSIPSKNNSLSKNSNNRNGYGSTMDDEISSTGASPTPPGSSSSPSPTPMLQTTKMKGANGLDLNMTAQEMRAMLAARKKEKMDPKTQKIDLRKKYDIVQTL